jgi:hypothetical protein
MLTLLAIIGVLVGAALGLKFKLYILAPVIFIGWAFVAIDGIARGYSGWWIASAMAAVAVSLQLGYLGMFVLKHSALAYHHSKISLPTTEIQRGRR